MEAEEFAKIRHLLGQSQTQLARLLCISPKAVQSFEQGWRKVSVNAERQMLFLLSLERRVDTPPCWMIRNCPQEWRDNCSAWKFDAGHFCWFLNGTYCMGEYRKSWSGKMEVCRGCSVFQKLMTPLPQNG